MHKTRARLLLPLDGALSYQHYPGLVRSISLELGNIYREVHEIKESAGWPAAKVNKARALKHDTLVVETGVAQEWGLVQYHAYLKGKEEVVACYSLLI
jgi:hypothetical protein